MAIEIREVKIEELAHYRGQWAELAHHVSEPNCCYEPWIFLAALKHLKKPKNPRFIFLFDRIGEGQDPLMVGFFPFVERYRYSGMLIPHLKFWRYEHCLYCAPLVRSGYEKSAAISVLSWIKGNKSVVVLNQLDADSLLYNAFIAELDNFPSIKNEELEQLGVIDINGAPEDYIKNHFSSNFRKELRRKENRLDKIGKVKFESCPLGQVKPEWLAEFLALEAQGWKGESGTALNSKAEDLNFISQIFKEGIEKKRISTASLRVDGKLIAASFMLHCSPPAAGLDHAKKTAFAFKITYDESLARMSPAMLLENYNIQELHKQKSVDRILTFVSTEKEMAKRLTSSSQRVVTTAIGFGTKAKALLGVVFPVGERIKKLLKK